MFDTDLLISRDGYDPRKDTDSYMNKRQLDYFKGVLERWKESLEEQLNKAKEFLHTASKDGGGDESDLAANETAILNETKKEERYTKLIAKINDAIRRIHTNEYGYCKVSDEPIGIERLMARPIATLCMEMQIQHEQEEAIRGGGLTSISTDTNLDITNTSIHMSDVKIEDIEE